MCYVDLVISKILIRILMLRLTIADYVPEISRADNLSRIKLI